MKEIYAIQIASKYTGELTWLGIPHESKDAAREYAEKEVCARCNRIEIYSFPGNWFWVDRRIGFRPVKEPA